MERGHMFVVQGDLLKLACDSVLVPTDQWLNVPNYWGRWVPASRTIPWLEPDRRVTHSWRSENQRVRYVNTAADDPSADVEWLRVGIRRALGLAAEEALNDGQPLHSRQRHLIGMPLFGVGAGGFGSVRGQVLPAVLEEAQAVTTSGIDVAIVCRERADYSALQANRPETYWTPGLNGDLIRQADRLGRMVQEGHAALFLGAGVSKAAGLPDWSTLLLRLAARSEPRLVGFENQVREDPPGAASQLHQALGTGFVEALRTELPSNSLRNRPCSLGFLASRV